jgi:DHA1 family multidrug resistance protein-like MFS transporter
MKTNNSRNVTILFFTLIVVMLGFGMIIPILPFYVESFNASGSTLGMLMGVYGLMQFLSAPFWGSLSDRIGRKPVLLIGVLGNALSQLLMGLSTQVWMLFAARILAGLLSSATLPTAMAFISDSTTEEDRGKGMGVVGAAMGLGMVLGPGLGGWLSTKSLALPFLLASGLSAVAFVLIVILLPESHHERSKEKSLRGLQLGALWKGLVGPIGVLYLMAFLLSFGLANFESVFGLYAQKRFDYGPTQVGIILMVVGFLSALIQGGLAGPLTRRFGEVRIIRAALLLTATGFVLMVLAGAGWPTWLATAFFVSSNAMLNPSVNSLVSRRAGGGQGMALGLNNSFQSLGRVAGPVWAGFTFDRSVFAPYLSGAAIIFVGFLVGIFKLEEKQAEAPAVEYSSAVSD